MLAEVGDMTNQLTHTDADITTLLVPASLPLPTSPAVNGGEPHWPTRSGRRWMLLAGGIALAATAVLGVAAAGNGPSNTVKPSTDQRSASAIVQDEIDAALAERNGSIKEQRSASAIVQDEIDAALAERNGSIKEQRSASAIVQDEIDAALAERNGSIKEQRSASAIVQDEIDAALAERNKTSVD